MPTPLLLLPEIIENQPGKYITHNEALALLEGLITRVLSRTNGGPPGTPSEGDTFVIDNAIEDWVDGSLDDIAHFYSGGWHFITPVEGLSIWCVDEDGRIYYTGSGWEVDYSSRININRALNDHDAVGVVDTRTVDANATGFGAAMFVASDGNLEEASAETLDTMRCMGLALESGTGQKQILRWGRIRDDSWSWTTGGVIFVSTTTGQLTQTAPSGSGQCVQAVGEAEASNIIFFNPSYDVIEIA